MVVGQFYGAWRFMVPEMTRLLSVPATYMSCERSEEHTSELQSQSNLVCRLLLEKKKKKGTQYQVRLVDMKSVVKTVRRYWMLVHSKSAWVRCLYGNVFSLSRLVPMPLLSRRCAR